MDEGEAVELLDGDLIRSKICLDLGFSRKDREDSLRRISFVADLLTRNGINVVVAAISPYVSLRSEIREQLSPFLEVFVNAPLAVCEQRDVKGLYKRCRNHEITGLTGVDDIYEPPPSPEVECRTDLETVEESVAKILAAIRLRRDRNFVQSKPTYRSRAALKDWDLHVRGDFLVSESRKTFSPPAILPAVLYCAVMVWPGAETYVFAMKKTWWLWNQLTKFRRGWRPFYLFTLT